jgi:hypothetical protein
MKFKTRALGLSAVAAMATGIIGMTNASAFVNGHFTIEPNGQTVVGTEVFETSHSLKFQVTRPTGQSSGGPIVCTGAEYFGAVEASTTTSTTLTPAYIGCATTGDSHGSVQITTNSCSYIFQSNAAASSDPPTEHATVSLTCPTGKAFEIHHPNCTMTIPPQTPKGGATYSTAVDGKHTITVNITLTHVATQYHGGICVFLGTPSEMDITGAVILKGLSGPTQVGVTAT